MTEPSDREIIAGLLDILTRQQEGVTDQARRELRNQVGMAVAAVVTAAVGLLSGLALSSDGPAVREVPADVRTLPTTTAGLR